MNAGWVLDECRLDTEIHMADNLCECELILNFGCGIMLRSVWKCGLVLNAIAGFAPRAVANLMRVMVVRLVLCVNIGAHETRFGFWYCTQIRVCTA